MQSLGKLTAAAALLALAGAAAAHGLPPHAAPTLSYDRLEWQQDQRIRHGIASGRLTAFEAQELRAEQARIDELERAFLADGRLHPAERDDLVRLQQQAARRIHAEKHDHQVAWR